MGVAEPSSPLWTAVKAVHDPWPPDDEVVAQQLADDWRRGADTVVRGAEQTHAGGVQAVSAWQDEAGGQLGVRTDENVRHLRTVEPGMVALANRSQGYSNALTSVKGTITSTIAVNEPIYGLLGAYPVFGPQLQQLFAESVARDLQGVVAAKAAELATPPRLTEQQLIEKYQVDAEPLLPTGDLVGSNLTVSEAALLASLGPGALWMPSIRDGAYSEAARRYPDLMKPGETVPRDHSHANAFQHAYWNAMMTREYGAEFAKAYGDAHERRPGNRPDNEAMDLFNNELGIRVATANPDASDAEIADAIQREVENGNAVVIDGGGHLRYSNEVPYGATGVPDDLRPEPAPR